jgi:hypothetical protein
MRLVEGEGKLGSGRRWRGGEGGWLRRKSKIALPAQSVPL